MHLLRTSGGLANFRGPWFHKAVKSTRALALLAGFLGFTLAAWAEPIQLQPQTNLVANGVALNPGSQSIPCVADWNGDGLPDLMVGYQPAWKVAVYTNSGTLAQPVFTTSVNVQAGGADIYMPASGCGSPAPFICDYDNDGKRDLLVGHGGNGLVYFYKNTNTDAHPMLIAGAPLTCHGTNLSMTTRATPYVCDWDNDGLNDLLCGDSEGKVHFFKNVGTAQNPAYASDVLLQAGGSTLNLGLRSVVRVVDWDGDGKKDLVGSGSDYAGWCRNVSATSVPVLDAKIPLQAPTTAGSLVNIDTGYRMRLEVVDWNHDGVPDLLIGNYDGRVFLYEGYHFAVRNLQALPDNRRALQWNSAPFLKYKVLWGGAVTGVTNSAATGLASGGKTTCWTNACPDPIRFYQVTTDP